MIKEQFYKEVQLAIDSSNRGDCVIVLGDMNAQINQETMLKDVIETNSLHKDSNENGELVIQMAMINNMKVMSTCFPYKAIHMGRWMIPGTANCNQIDHVLI